MTSTPRHNTVLVVLLFLGLSVPCVFPAVKPNSLFTHHMVLQQGLPAPVWGKASPGEKIFVSLGERARAETVTAPDGRWMAILPPLKTSTEPVELIIRGENEIRIHDVLVGEVWIGSGQSNMGVTINETWDARRIQSSITKGNFSGIRLFRVEWTASDEPLADTNSHWQTCTPAAAGAFSATLFYFGEALQKALPGTPIGLISSCVGGTNAHAWIPKNVFETDPAADPVRKWYQAQLQMLPQKDPVYDRELAAHEEKTASFKKAGQPLPKELQRPPEPPMGPRSKRRPASLYNGMIAPLMPYAIQGVLWYQGENNSSLEWAPGYADLMTSLIGGWRTAWAKAANAEKIRAFPFYIAQLPNFPNNNAWPLLREQQLKILRQTPETDMAVLIDCGDPNTIHPANKTPVGQRLALLARAHAYGEKLTANGPLFQSVSFVDDHACVIFDQEDIQSSDGQPLRNFEIAGADRTFHPATAILQGKTITLKSPQVPQPIAVRYAWANNPENINFYNADGLPASPFRTDNWPWTPSPPSVPPQP